MGDERAMGAARARLFRLLARIVADGLNPDMRALLGLLPEIADVVADDVSEDDDAADHQDLFGFRVPPYASLFLDDALRVGGPASDAAAAAYAEAGFDRVREDLGPDHLAVELAFLAHCAEGDQDAAAARFMDVHVFGWLPAAVAAIRREPYAAYAGLTAVVVEAVLDYREAIGGEAIGPPVPGKADDLLERRDTGVRTIAEYLTVPARSGLFLGRGDVMRLARSIDAPRGFGGRVLMLSHLLRSAAGFDRLDDLVDGIDAVAVQTQTMWSGVASGGVGSTRTWAAIRTARIEDTRALLARLAERVRAEGDQNSS